MLKIEPKQSNFYSVLYHRIPENHILNLINSAISFNFVNKLLEGSYCSSTAGSYSKTYNFVFSNNDGISFFPNLVSFVLYKVLQG